MHAVCKIWNNFSLKTKLSITIVLVNIFLFTSATLIGIRIITGPYNELLYQTLASNLSVTAKNIQTNLSNIRSMSDMIIANTSVQKQLDYLTVPEDIPEKRTVDSVLYNTLLLYYDNFKNYGVSYISIYSNDFSVHTYRPDALKVPSDIISSLKESAVSAKGAPVWNTDNSENNQLFLTRSIRKIDYMDLSVLGTLNISVDIDKFVSNAMDLENYDSFIYLLYNNNKNIYSSDEFSAETVNYIYKNSDSPYGVIKINKDYYFAVNGFIPDYNWKYVCMVPYNSIFTSVYVSRFMYIGIFFISVIISIICSNTIITNITKHIEKLIYKMNHFKGQETPSLKDDYNYNIRNDEIGVLHQQFNHMVLEIHSLIRTNYESKLLIKDAQLKALTAQINPHFLYNTLESINYRAKAIGASDISAIAESLGALFRATLNSDSAYHSLQKELELITGYMTIQLLRYESRLTYKIDADPSLLDIMIPKLIIQPLVENSIRYALEQSIEPCHIAIIIKKSSPKLMIQVRNNGSSFEENLLEKLRADQVQTHGFGIGILNIDNRIKLTFGSEYGVALYNEGEIAVAQIIIPL